MKYDSVFKLLEGLFISLVLFSITLTLILLQIFSYTICLTTATSNIFTPKLSILSRKDIGIQNSGHRDFYSPPHCNKRI